MYLCENLLLKTVKLGTKIINFNFETYRDNWDNVWARVAEKNISFEKVTGPRIEPVACV